MKKYTVYEIKMENGLTYIGATRDFKHRMHVHKSYAKNTPITLVNKAMARHKWSVRAIKTGLSHERALALEEKLIKTARCKFPFGLNVTAGGKTPPNKGKPSPLRGKKRPASIYNAEWRRKQSESKMGSVGYWKGKKRYPETIEKIRLAKKGLPNIQCRKRIKDENGNIYPSVDAAAKKLGISRPNISTVLNGRRLSAGGHRFEHIK